MPKTVKVAIGVAAAAVVVFSVGSYAVDRQMLEQTYARHAAQGPSLLLANADVAASYPSEAVEFQLDGKTLRGRV